MFPYGARILAGGCAVCTQVTEAMPMKQKRRRRPTLSVPPREGVMKEIEGLLHEGMSSMARCLLRTAFVMEALEKQDSNATGISPTPEQKPK